MPRRDKCTHALAIATLIVCAVAATEASATAQRTFVASTGNDANPCSITLPCRGFTAALAQTLPGGEVIVLDSAGYGPVTIGKSAKIIAPPGVYAGVSVSSGDGIAIDAPGITVVLRGLTINGQGGINGVHFVNGATLHVESCEISGFTGLGHNGITIDAPGGGFYIKDTIVRDNRNGLTIGPLAVANLATGTISRSRFENNDTEGIIVLGSARLAMEDSVIAGSAYNVDVFTEVSLAEVHLTITRTLIQRGSYGLYIEPNSVSGVDAYVSDSTISGNALYGVAIVPLAGALTPVEAMITRTHLVDNPVNLGSDGALGGPIYLILDGSSMWHDGPSPDVQLSSGSVTFYTRSNNTLGSGIAATNGATVSPYPAQ